MRAAPAEATIRWIVVAAALWVVCVGAYAAGFFLGLAEAPPPGLAAVLFLAAAVGPLAPVAAGVSLLRAAGARAASPETPPTDARSAQGLNARLDAIDAALRAVRAQLSARPETSRPDAPRSPSPRPEAPRRAARAAEGRAAERAPAPTRTTAPAPAPAPADQPALPFADGPGDDAAAAPIPWSDVVRAFDFPRHAKDAEGFAALRSALRDPEAQRLLQAAEDVLSILAAEGLHMEDLAPELAPLDAWAAYAEGARGAAMAAIGGVRDEAAVAAAQARLRGDAIFRDAALVFIRRWNQFLARVARELGPDETLREIADTRTGRAFMLTARALGAFG